MASFVYFDIGGVVVLDFSGTDKWEQLKKELGVTADKGKEFEAFWNEHEPEACVGKDVETLLPMIKERFGSKLPKGYSLLMDGFVNRFEVNRPIWPVINKIKKSCRVGLLTNMYPRMLDAIRGRGIMPDVAWDIVIDSSAVGLRKPDPRIFKLAEQKAGAKGDKILFVENNLKNLSAAADSGWQTFTYDPVHPKESSDKLSGLFP